jgi:hypothetical protein
VIQLATIGPLRPGLTVLEIILTLYMTMILRLYYCAQS